MSRSRWVVVREHIPALVGPGTNVPGRSWKVELRRLSASEPMSKTVRRNGVPKLCRSWVGYGIVVSLKMLALGDVGNFPTRL